MNLVSLFQDHGRSRPDQPAIICAKGRSDTRVTFAQLDERSARSAALLTSRGITQGDRVLMLVPLSIELYVALLALLRLGAVPVLVDPGAGLAHVDRCCSLVRPAAMIGTSKAQTLRLLSRAVRTIPRHFVIGARWLPGTPWSARKRLNPWPGVLGVPPDAPALLTFTSGSTGAPKAVVRSHGLLLAQQRALSSALALQPGAVDLVTLPVFVLANLAAGTTSALPAKDLRCPGRINALGVLDFIDRHTPTSTVASPALLSRLTDACALHYRSMASLQRVFTGGGPVFWHHLDAIARAAPDARVFAIYGSTEAEPIAEVALDQLSDLDREATRAGRGLPAGAPVPEIQLRIIADHWGTPLGPLNERNFASLQLPRGAIGEILVSGDHVVRGYLCGAGDSESKIRVESAIWHRTGDSGFLDDTGRLWLTGRCASKVVDEHGTIYPLQVEAAAHSIVPVPRLAFLRIGGHRTLVLETKSPSLPQLTRVLMHGLEWARIARVTAMTNIPVDARHNSKIDYARLSRLRTP